MLDQIIQYGPEALMGLMVFLAFIVRITPTKTDDGWFKKIDDIVNKIFDFLKLPNIKK